MEGPSSTIIIMENQYLAQTQKKKSTGTCHRHTLGCRVCVRKCLFSLFGTIQCQESVWPMAPDPKPRPVFIHPCGPGHTSQHCLCQGVDGVRQGAIVKLNQSHLRRSSARGGCGTGRPRFGGSGFASEAEDLFFHFLKRSETSSIGSTSAGGVEPGGVEPSEKESAICFSSDLSGEFNDSKPHAWVWSLSSVKSNSDCAMTSYTSFLCLTLLLSKSMHITGW